MRKSFPRKPLYKRLETGHLFSAQMAGGGVTGQRARSTGVELKHKRYVFDPVNGWSLRLMFRLQLITQIILLAKVINTHMHNYSLLILLAGRENLCN